LQGNGVNAAGFYITFNLPENPMVSSAYHLIKRDSEVSSGLEIATYRVAKCGLEGGQRYVICKNNKRIGWAMEETSAMRIHDLYTGILCLTRCGFYLKAFRNF
jgi:hypothetical protein